MARGLDRAVLMRWRTTGSAIRALVASLTFARSAGSLINTRLVAAILARVLAVCFQPPGFMTDTEPPKYSADATGYFAGPLAVPTGHRQTQTENAPRTDYADILRTDVFENARNWRTRHDSNV